MTDHIPLNKLILSARNVRKTNGDEDIESLADSIHSKGLLQNLVVSQSPGGKLHEVDAGGRRWRALQLNVKLKRIPRNHPVPCKVIPLDDGLEASLAENLQKIAMNPADEVEAFAAIIDRYEVSGANEPIVDLSERITNCARRFGRTENYVRQRLRLAALAPEILDALRNGQITIETARAYATHPDHKVQLKVFAAEEKKRENWQHDPKSVRDQLAGKIYSVDHMAVRYIGLEAYAEAGGRVETDLFFGEGEREILLDPAIVDKLAKEKAEKEAQTEAQNKGWATAAIAPINGGEWAEPRPPKGFLKKWGEDPESVEKQDRGSRIIGYRLKTDGSGIEPCQNSHFVPETEPADQGDPANLGMHDYEKQRRREAIELQAARLAAPSIKNTPLEGRAFWPTDEWDQIEIVTAENGKKSAFVTLLIEIPFEDLEARFDDAEQHYEQEQAKQAAEAEDDDPEKELQNPAVNDGETETADRQVAA